MATFNVYVPRPGTPTAMLVLPRSGCVGEEIVNHDETTIMLDVEGNKYDSSSMRTFANRVLHAAGRQAQRYPTVARFYVNPADLLLVGTYDDQYGEVTVTDEQTLSAWLGIDHIPPDELVTDSYAQEMRRFGRHYPRSRGAR